MRRWPPRLPGGRIALRVARVEMEEQILGQRPFVPETPHASQARVVECPLPVAVAAGAEDVVRDPDQAAREEPELVVGPEEQAEMAGGLERDLPAARGLGELAVDLDVRRCGSPSRARPRSRTPGGG